MLIAKMVTGLSSKSTISEVKLYKLYLYQTSITFMAISNWLPASKGTMNQSCFNVGSASATLVQHWNNIGSKSKFKVFWSVFMTAVWHESEQASGQEAGGGAEVGVNSYKTIILNAHTSICQSAHDLEINLTIY